MLKQLDGLLSVSIDFDSWLTALPLANYQPIETLSLPSNRLDSYSIGFDSWFRALPLANYHPRETLSLPSYCLHSVSIDVDSWLRALPLANYQLISLPSNRLEWGSGSLSDLLLSGAFL